MKNIEDISCLKNLRRVYAQNLVFHTLDAFRSFENLNELYLHNTPVNDFSGVKKLKNLIYLEVSGTKITEAVMNDLKKENPYLKIIHN